MTYIILVNYIFTSDITYLSFAAIARCSIPEEKPRLRTWSQLTWSTWLWRSVSLLSTCTRLHVCTGFILEKLNAWSVSFGYDTSLPCHRNWHSLNLPLTQTRIWQSGQQLWQAAELMITFLAQSIKRIYTTYINGIYQTYTKYMTSLKWKVSYEHVYAIYQAYTWYKYWSIEYIRYIPSIYQAYTFHMTIYSIYLTYTYSKLSRTFRYLSHYGLVMEYT